MLPRGPSNLHLAACARQTQSEAAAFNEESLGVVLTVLSEHTTNQELSQSAAETLSVRQAFVTPSLR
jgi:hypothetical protein